MHTDRPPDRGLRTLAPSPAVAGLLLGISGLLVAPSAALAAASLTTASGKPTLTEAAFDLDVHIDGVVAWVESRQTIANPGNLAEEAVYTFDLPTDAAITGLVIQLADGRTSTTTVVDADLALSAIRDPEGFTTAPDLGLLRLVARDVPEIGGVSPFAKATYELRVYPVSPGRTATAKIRWVAPMSYADGRLSLRIPGRGDASNLVREQVALRAQPPPGVRGLGAVHGGGRLLGKGSQRARFKAPPHGDLVIDAGLDFGPRANRPVASVAKIPISDDFGVLGLALLTPLSTGQAALDYERLLLVIDVSRSLGTAGLAAAATLADALLAGSPSNTAVEIVLFDRQARQVFGEFRPNDRRARKALAKALQPAALRNGSDLGAALDTVRTMLTNTPLPLRPADGFERGVHAPTLVAVITDGMTPLSLTPRRILDRLGEQVGPDVEVLSLLLGPDEAPVPEIRTGALPALAQKTSGRTLGIRFGEARSRAQTLAAELARPAPLYDIAIESPNAIIDGINIPRILEPGSGIIGVGRYRGTVPDAIAVTATNQGAPVRIATRRVAALKRAGLPLGLANAQPEDFIRDRLASGVDTDDTVYDRATLQEAHRLLLNTAQRAATVTRHSALVALDRGDRFARERLALAQKWGAAAFFRLPSPPQRQPDHQFRNFRRRVLPGTHAGTDPGRRTGSLDRNIVERLVETYVIPQARACYQKALRKNSELRGSVLIVLELARGEVQHAEVQRSTLPGGDVEACITDSAYDLQVPRVALGADPETVDVVRYPLTFQRSRRGSEVRGGDQEIPEIKELLDSDDPLVGLE